jgi:hypothetical protein
MTMKDAHEYEGKRVRMTKAYKRMLGRNAHVREFGTSIGVCIGWTKYFNKMVVGDGEGETPVSVGPEVDVRWQPSNLRYGYAPEWLELVDK